MTELRQKILNIFSLNIGLAIPISIWLCLDGFKRAWQEISKNQYLQYKLFRITAGLLRDPLSKLSIFIVILAIGLSVIWLLLGLLLSKSKIRLLDHPFENIKRRIRKVALFILIVLTAVNAFLFIEHKFFLPNGPNVVLIGIDTLRADHLSCYGYQRKTTPAIDALATEGVLFTETISLIPSTTASFASILTSKSPISHGLLRNNTEGFSLDDRHVTLAELLKNNGYLTAAFVSGWTMKSNGNLIQGFDVYDDQFAVGEVRTGERKAEEVNKEVFAWLDNHSNSKFFLFVHYFDPHGKYDPPKPFKKYFDPNDGTIDLSVILDDKLKEKVGSPRWFISQYDGEIRYSDYAVEQLMKKLSDFGLLDNTLVIVTSDHGETLIEHHRWWDHGRFVYEEQIHVPLIFWCPKLFQTRKINSLTRLVDVFPTILDLLKIDFTKDVEGRSLYPFIAGKQGKEVDYVFSESVRGDPRIFKDEIDGVRGKKFSIRSKEWKLIWVPKTNGIFYELYNLKEDPNELDNLTGKRPGVEPHLRKKLDAYVQMYKKAPYYIQRVDKTRPKEFSEDKELMEVFKSLGYL